MAIILPSGFNITNNEPVDARLTLADESTRYALSSANVYEGLIVFQQDNDTIWVLTDTSNVGNSNGWTQLQIGSVDSNLPSGVVSGSDQLTSSYDSRYVNETDFTSFSSSVDTRFDLLETNSSSLENIFEEKSSLTHTLVSGSSQVISILDSLNLYTQSNDTTNTTQNSRLDQLSTYTGSNETAQSAQNSRLSSLESFSGSQETKNSTLATYTASVDSRLNQLSTDSGSQAGRLSNLESFTQSIDTAFDLDGQNVTIAGNLTVQGTTTQVNSTTVQIGDNIIELNGTGATNGGLLVKDPTAPNTVSGSLLWDSTNDYWKAGASGAESKLLRADGDSVVSGSSQVSYPNLSNIPSGIVSGSSQITYSGISSIPSGIVSGSTQITPLLPSGTVSGSSQVLGNTGIVSSSAQIDTLGFLKVGGDSVISGSSQVTLSGDITGTANNTAIGTGVIVNDDVNASAAIAYTKLNLGNSGIVSGSTQIDALGFLKVGGDSVISGSSQVNADTITNFDANVLTYNNSLGVVSGSAQITKTLQQVTTAGNTTSTSISITNSTASTSKTTGALVVTGGIGTSGDIFAGGDVVAYASSDIRLKNNLELISNPLQKINKIGGYSFEWNTEKQDIYNGKDYGVIAQEIEQILPELVDTRENGYKAVKYDKLVSLLIEGIKDLSKQVEDLKEKINKG